MNGGRRPLPTAPADPDFVPALRFHVLTPLYDAVVRATTRERAVKEALIRQARPQPGQRVLDLATGTGTLAIRIKQRAPEADVTGVGIDPGILAIAMRKAHAAGAEVHFDRAPSQALPYPAASFDRILSSLFFHHLSWSDKLRTARELMRVLKPEGELHVADWGRPANALMRGLFLMVQCLDGFESTRDNVAGRLTELYGQAGFREVAERQTFNTVLGTVALYSAARPGETSTTTDGR